MVLLPPPASTAATAVVNITIVGTSLCAGSAPRIANVTVADVPCAALVCSGRDWLAVCTGWNASSVVAALPGGATSTFLNASGVWTEVTPPAAVYCDDCIAAATRPVLRAVVPPIVAAAGVPIVVTGTGLLDAAASPPTVLVGGTPCMPVSVLTAEVVQCIVPTVENPPPSFPVVPVVVINAAGAASTEVVTLSYPDAFVVAWAPASTAARFVALPGVRLTQPPALSLLSRDAATCSLTLNATGCGAAGTGAVPARPTGMSITVAAADLAVPASTSGNATSTLLPLQSAVASGASSCIGTLAAACLDAAGNAAASSAAASPLVVFPTWGAAWAPNVSNLAQPWVVAPAPLPRLSATFALDDDDAEVAAAIAGGGLDYAGAVAAALSCLAVLLPEGTPTPSMEQPLDRLPPRSVLSSATATVALLTPTIASLSFDGLTAAGVPLGGSATVAAECTWTYTGERVRLPSMSIRAVSLQASWSSAAARVVQGYLPVELRLGLVISAPVTVSPAGDTSLVPVTCSMRVVNVTAAAAGSATAVADDWTVNINPAATPAAALDMSVNVTLQAPPGTLMALRVQCTAWDQVVSTPPRPLTAAMLTLRLDSPPPTSFIASDTTAPAPLQPALVLSVVTVEAGDAVTAVACTLATTTPGAALRVLDPASSLQSMATRPDTGAVSVPPFVVQASLDTPALTLVATCRHTRSGDSPPPLTLVIPATILYAAFCAQPAATSAVGQTLPPLRVGIGMRESGGAVTTAPCAAANTAPAITLPPIACTITLNTTGTNANDTANIFLRNTAATVALDTRVATFDAFSLVAEQGQSYGLIVACSVGGLAVPPALSFTLSLEGCAPGQEAVLVACVTCGGGKFSVGGMDARCVGCPPAGATCDSGIITLQPRYFRPAAQAGQPLGPNTELHPCYNAEACTLTYNNDSSVPAYGCTHGYTGPLCGVCDASINYARFGDACAPCWDTGASVLFLAIALTIVLGALAHMALFSEVYNSYPDDAIVLRIAMSYLQGIGSLRVFIAGSTQAYASVMGWTEVVSASPMSVGAIQCLLRLPYLTQYAGTVLLPVMAAAIVIVIFLIGTIVRSVHCGMKRVEAGAGAAAATAPSAVMRRTVWLDVDELKGKLASWWASKRHISTMLFVLFLTYMPITSASLRALDCIDPVAGIRYLRSNLAVECGVGQHAAATALAYTTLVVVGAGFPVGLAWLLGTARKEQLLDTGFHATWGFLFDGYRTPERVLLAVPASSAPAAPRAPGRAHQRRRSSFVPERLTQTWVVEGESRVWWEGVVIARKAGVVLLAVMVTNPFLQCVGATLLFFCAILLQLKYQPYIKPKFNRLELATLTATFTTAVISTSLLQFNVDVATADLHPPAAMTPIEWTVTIALVLINMGMFLALGFLWLRVQWDRARVMARALRSSRSTSVSSPPPPPPPGDKPAHADAGGVLDSPMMTSNPLRAAQSARFATAALFAATTAAPAATAGESESVSCSAGDIEVTNQRRPALLASTLSFAATPIGSRR